MDKILLATVRVGQQTPWYGQATNITQLTASDGYNTLSVRHAYDNEGFICPIEDYRFQFRINVAGYFQPDLLQ